MNSSFTIFFVLLLAAVLTVRIVKSAGTSDIDMSRLGPVQTGLIALAKTFELVGILGFLSFFLASTGGLTWLPESFEWPIGRTDNVLVTSDETHVVRNSASSRVQIYDAELKYQRGWWIEAYGGVFKLVPVDEESFYVYTARGSQRYHYDHFGRLISADQYGPGTYSDVPDVGQYKAIPTPVYLRPFTHPFASIGLTFFGSFLLWGIRHRNKHDGHGGEAANW